MATPMATATTCSVCGEPLNAKGECLACLIRAALDESVAKSAPPVSLVFGDFEIVRCEDGSLWELGRGGMGVTYLAEDKVLRRKVALKVIQVPTAARTSQAVRERFLREARAAAALRHPNVATVFQFGAPPDGKHCYYAMELVEGETLEARVRREGPLDAKLVLEIARQVARALMAAAAQGLIHRDLKPGNIMLTRSDADTAELEVKIIDFGLAKAMADAGGDGDLTHGEFVGTANFASPEQFGTAPVDVRSDIYSLGATLWFALTGKAPFAGRNIEEICAAQKSNALPIEQMKAARVPSRLRSLLESMLAFEPAARPGIQDLAAQLRRCSALASRESNRRSRAALAGAAKGKKEIHLEIAHVLFIDIVGFSKLSLNQQQAAIGELNEIARGSAQFQKSEADGQLLKLATGDGMALVFTASPQAPAQCAVEITRALQARPHLAVRMGMHSGPVQGFVDLRGNANAAGAGMNIAQRVMSCGDAGHILVSKHAAEDLAEFERWRTRLHELGTTQVKYGTRIHLVNLHDDEIGNPAIPTKVRAAQHRRWRWRAAVAAGAALMALGLVLGIVVYRSRNAATARAPEKSIAVLPFENLSEEKANAFFADGVMDEILTDLARIADLKVISRTSVMQYKNGATRNLRQIAKELGVANVVEGRVQRSGNRVRVNAQLIDARTDRQLWGQTYDRNLADIFKIQSELAQAIADQLHAKLSPAEKTAIEQPPTSDLKAYDFYSEAKQLLTVWHASKDAKQAITRSLALLDKATQRDPNFALAYCQAVEAHLTMYSYFDGTPTRVASAKEALDSAVRLAPDLGETHLAVGRYVYVILRDFDTARKEVAIALRTLPNDADAIAEASYIDRRQARWEESLAGMRKANRLDPHNIEVIRSIADTLYALRRYRDEEDFLRRQIALAPYSASLCYMKLAECYLGAGNLEEAKSALEGMPSDYDPNEFGTYYRYRTAIFMRDFARARTILDGAPEMLPGSVNSNFFLPRSWYEGEIARAQGNFSAAGTIFTDTRARLVALFGEEPNEALQLAALARVEAMLNRRKEAIRKAERAVELLPITKDSIVGAWLCTSLAAVYGWTGEGDLALQQLKKVAEIPAGVAYGDLKFNPWWDGLRGDPRFEKLVAALAPKPN
jgi:serine/threonine protein kinase/TolB-like protein/Tfp pilus assembly protein PilF